MCLGYTSMHIIQLTRLESLNSVSEECLRLGIYFDVIRFIFSMLTAALTTQQYK